MDLDIATHLSICSPLSKLLEGSFGPNALKILMKSDTGKVLISADGATILRTLHIAHPVGKFIVKSVITYGHYYGGGCKIFLFMLTEALRNIQHLVDGRGSSCRVQSSPSDNAQTILLCNAIEELTRDVLPQHVYSHVIKKCVVSPLREEKREQLRDECKNVIRTSLNGKWSKEVVSCLSSLLHELVFKSCRSVIYLKDVIDKLVDYFHIVCLKSPTQHVSDSKIFNGLLLKKDFLFHPDFLRDHNHSIKFVLLGCPMELQEGENNSEAKDIIKINSASKLQKCAVWQKTYVQEIVSSWKEFGIHVVFTSCLVSKLEHALFEQNKIAVVQTVPEEDLQYISLVSKCRIISDQCEELSQVNTGTAAECKVVTFGGQRFVHLLIEGTEQMIVCGVTDGLCQQYYNDLHISLKSLRMWLDTARFFSNDSSTSFENFSALDVDEIHSPQQSSCKHNESINSPDPDITVTNLLPASFPDMDCSVLSAFAIPGGGYFEMLIHYHLDLFVKETKNPILRSACEVLKNACLVVPKMLHSNSFAEKAKKRSFQILYKSLMDSLKCGTVTCIDHRQGTILSDHRFCLEPLASKVALLDHVCTVLVQLLRMDALVSVNRICDTGEVDEQ